VTKALSAVRADSTDSPNCLPVLLSISVFPLFSFWFRAVD